jgi:hypothetical protein
MEPVLLVPHCYSLGGWSPWLPMTSKVPQARVRDGLGDCRSQEALWLARESWAGWMEAAQRPLLR